MKTIILILTLFLSASVSSQPIPPPVNLPIPNIPQETEVWCWAAVAQQIIHARKGPAQTPAQCALVAMANNAHSNFCCSGMGNSACVRTGSMQQIQYLIGQFGGSFSALYPPTDPMTLYWTLNSGRAIILHVNSGQMQSHVVVLTGMSFVPNAFGGVEPILHINDPLSYFNQPVPYRSLVPIWIEALVVN